MSFFTRLRAWMRPQPAAPVLLPDPSPLPVLAEAPALTPETALPVPAEGIAAPISDWLDNEDLLRDEAVLFGLSDTDPAEKLGAIRSAFAERAAGLEHERERLDEKIGELNLWINQNEDQIAQLDTRVETLQTATFPESHHLPRVGVGLLLSVGMAVGTYFLIADTLRPAYPDGDLVALGVFLAGMFTLFGRTAVLHGDERIGPRWKRLFEEIGVPLAAAAFVLVHAYESQPPLRAWALGTFVFLLFLFSGKLLLGHLTLLKLEWDVYARQQQLRRDKVHQVREWETEIETLKAAIAAHRSEKQDILPRYADVTGRLLQLTARRDRLVHLFESEYALAKNYRNRLTRRQLQRLTGPSFPPE